MGYIGNQSAGITYTNINTFRGKVANLTALSAVSGMGNGDLYITEDNNHAHMYTGTVWVDLGEITGPQGPIGPKGIAGASVSTVVRTTGDGSAGTTDVYTITYNDATTSTFSVYNGEDGIPGTINHIKRTVGTGAAGTTDTYTAYADAAETQILGTFNVHHGYDGVASTIGTLLDVDLTTVPVEDGQTIVWNAVKGKWLPGDVSSSAINMTYDNTTSSLTATDVQGAIDEIENSVVKLTGNQTIEDVKTFNSSPIVPTPTAATQATNKAYVDNKIVASSNVVAGVIRIATVAETQNGTDNTTAITPLRLRIAFNASGTAPIYACRAWVNFDGTGTVAIRASGNVSSITDNGTGDYTVNFTMAMPDANYSSGYCGSNKNNGTENSVLEVITTTTFQTSSSFRFISKSIDGGGGMGTYDHSLIVLNFFR